MSAPGDPRAGGLHRRGAVLHPRPRRAVPKHETARDGNRFGIIGMAIALVATILAATGGVSVADVGA